jgi:hypothetical protein
MGETGRIWEAVRDSAACLDSAVFSYGSMGGAHLVFAELGRARGSPSAHLRRREMSYRTTALPADWLS